MLVGNWQNYSKVEFSSSLKVRLHNLRMSVNSHFQFWDALWLVSTIFLCWHILMSHYIIILPSLVLVWLNRIFSAQMQVNTMNLNEKIHLVSTMKLSPWSWTIIIWFVVIKVKFATLVYQISLQNFVLEITANMASIKRFSHITEWSLGVLNSGLYFLTMTMKISSSVALKFTHFSYVNF